MFRRDNGRGNSNGRERAQSSDAACQTPPMQPRRPRKLKSEKSGSQESVAPSAGSGEKQNVPEITGKLRLKENNRGVAILSGQIDGLKIGELGLEPVIDIDSANIVHPHHQQQAYYCAIWKIQYRMVGNRQPYIQRPVRI